MITAILAPLLAMSAVSAQALTCEGVPVTVDLSLGQMPTPDADVIAGTNGDDIIAAMGGDDMICGFGGNDIIWGQAGNDLILGGDGDDKLRGGAGDDYVFGQAGADDLAGGTGDDLVDGGDGDDTAVRGGTGADRVVGGLGNDALVAGNGGQDNADGGPGDDKVTGGPRPDVIMGGDGDDELKGHKGADYINGGPGNDSLFGGPQPDDLDGGLGDNDICNGGTTGDGAIEDDNAINCAVEANVEGSDVDGQGGIGPTRVIGRANLGGPVVNPVAREIQAFVILESNPEQIQITFGAGPDGCFAADAVAIAIEQVVLLELLVGAPVGGPDVCPAVLVQHTITIQLTEPLNGRDIIPLVSVPPPGVPGGDLLGLGTLGPELGDDLSGIQIDSVEAVVGPPDTIIVGFQAGPAACVAAEAAAFGYEDRIEILAVVSTRADLPPGTACAAVLESHEITIPLDQSIDGRPLVLGEPLTFPPPGPTPIPVPIPGSTQSVWAGF